MTGKIIQLAHEVSFLHEILKSFQSVNELSRSCIGILNLLVSAKHGISSGALLFA